MRRVYLAKISTLTETHNKEIEREQSCKKMDYHCNGLFHQFRSWTNKIDKKISTQNYTLPIWTIVKNDLIVHSTTNVKSRIFFHDSDIALGCFIYILDSSNSSSITFWTSWFGSSSRSNWTSIWTSNSNGS